MTDNHFPSECKLRIILFLIFFLLRLGNESCEISRAVKFSIATATAKLGHLRDGPAICGDLAYRLLGSTVALRLQLEQATERDSVTM